MIFVGTLSSCSLGVSAVSPSAPPHERTVPAMHGMTHQHPTLSGPHSLSPTRLALRALPAFFIHSHLVLFIQNSPVLSFFRSIRLLVDTDVGCLLELSNRKFPESLGAQNWKRNNRKVEREANPARMNYDLPFFG